MLVLQRLFVLLSAFFLYLYGGFGITGGAHRLWAHRSYKAKWPLRLFAALAQTMSVQVNAFEVLFNVCEITDHVAVAAAE